MLKFNEDVIKNYNEDSDIGYIFEVDIEYPKNLHDLHSDLPFFLERMKFNRCSRLACNLHDKKNYVVHVRTLKQAFNQGLVLKIINRVIKFNKKSWLKLYVDMITKLRTEAKNDFEKDFFKLMQFLERLWKRLLSQ